MMNYYKESQKMYNEIVKDIHDISVANISDEDINSYKYVRNIIGLSDGIANDCLWSGTSNSDKDIDWGRVYDELDMLHGDMDSLNATIEDELNKV